MSYIISEPTAAALAYGMDKRRGDSRIAVYDLGGGTFGISIVEIAEVEGDYHFEVLSTDGCTHLGGEDFDTRIAEYFRDMVETRTGVNVKDDPVALQRPQGSGGAGEDRVVLENSYPSGPAIHRRRLNGTEAPPGNVHEG